MDSNILKFKEFQQLKTLEYLIDYDMDKNNRGIMMSLYPFRNKPLPKNILDKLFAKLNQGIVKNEFYNTWFNPNEYKTFMEYFLRQLTSDVSNSIKTKIKNSDFILPCEAIIKGIGSINDTSKILSLKKDSKETINDLELLGIDTTNLGFINMSLHISFYHRVHSPIQGKITNIIPVNSGSNLFGCNSLSIIEIESMKFGKVYLMVIGEYDIQDFDFKVKIGDNVKKFDEIGNFNWGSQVVMLYDLTKIKNINLIDGQTYFVGEVLC